MGNLERVFEKVEKLINDGNLSFDYGFHLINKNYSTGKNYTGMFNNLVLSIARSQYNYRFPYWIGFNQALKSYIPIKKGEAGVPILIRKTKNVFIKDGLEIDNEEDADYSKVSSFYSEIHVFNIEQTNVDLESVNKYNFSEDTTELNKLLDKYLAVENIDIVKGHGVCSYNIVQDKIKMVDEDSFYDKLAYSEALTHEIVHSTGHEKRLSRNMNVVDANVRADEEIIAEFGTMMILSEYELERRDKDMAFYIRSWLKDNNIKDIYSLCLQSQKAVDYIKKTKIREEL